LKDIDIQDSDILVSLFTNLAIDEVVQVISKKLYNDHTLSERSTFPVEAIMELLEACLSTSYFHVDDCFYQQKDFMAPGTSLSPVVSKIYMEHF
jgi:hypothetical protein